MKWLKRIFIVIGISILLGGGSFALYGLAYSEGKTAGYEDGYSEGETAGYEDGYSVGHEAGYSVGHEAGYSLGEQDGYDEGYEVGVEAGLGHGYTLRDPTYEEVITFLGQDKTDENEYIEDTYGVYVCSHFTRDVDNNAEEAGLRCAFVELRYPDGGHAIIAFDTIDEGLVYFDAQTDERVRPVIGKRYYQCIEPKPGYYYPRPSYDDTINDILVIW